MTLIPPIANTEDLINQLLPYLGGVSLLTIVYFVLVLYYQRQQVRHLEKVVRMQNRLFGAVLLALSQSQQQQAQHLKRRRQNEK